MSKLIVIVGPTASGKSALAVRLAKKFGGEIISADSRQVYEGMDIGTGKITQKETRGIPHYLLDVASPKKKFTVVRYRQKAVIAINRVFKKNKVPFLVGGTGFYIQAVVNGIMIPRVAPDWKLRRELERKTTQELFLILKKIDPLRAETIESKNKRRIIRAIEIVKKTGEPVPPLAKSPFPADVLIIGIKKSKNELKAAIRKRLLKRLKLGMLAEVKRLLKSGVSYKRLEEFGLEYRYAARYLQGELTYSDMVRQLQKAIEHYARRQMVWFKRDKRIHWVKNYKVAHKLALNFVRSS